MDLNEGRPNGCEGFSGAPERVSARTYGERRRYLAFRAAYLAPGDRGDGGGWLVRMVAQILEGPCSAVSKPIFKENFIFAEFFRDLQKLQIFAPLETQAL